jgi:uncharacterized protein DUF11
MRTSRGGRRAVALGAIVPVVGAVLVAVASTPAGASGGKVQGLGNNDFLFVSALKTSSVHVAQVAAAQTAAGVGKPFKTEDKLGQLLLTKLSKSGKNAYGHGQGISLNLGQGDNKAPQAALTAAEATSPKPSSKKTSLLDLSNTPLKPVVSANVQPDTAVANTQSANNYCVVGAPLSMGTAHVADLSVLNLTSSTSVLKANQAVVTESAEQLVPNGKGNFGLSTTSVVEPVGITLFKGVPGAALTIKILNPLVLRANALGVPGKASVAYGANGDGKIPVVAITAGGSTQKLTMDQLVGSGGVKLHLGVADVEIGVPPTVKTSTAGTKASATADLVSIQIPGTKGISASVGGPLGSLLNPILQPVVSGLNPVLATLQSTLKSLGLQVADIRVAHQETSAQVPAGGISCPIPVRKTANPNPVVAGHDFVYTITATNTVCAGGLEDVMVDDKITADPGVKWTVKSTRPKADKVSNSEVVWNDIGTIPYGKSKSVHITVAVDSNSAGGLFHDHAHVTGKCGTGNANGKNTTVNLTGRVSVDIPKVNTQEMPNTGLSTRWPLAGIVLALAAGAAAVLRRRVTD